ncbi:unnamed protein product [Vitrella brassicaformis CCMP3155]|uniref:RNA helicase n=2 Tax=Vitrella brassicaformis TaxID=1169539 RepID=A0A0G4G1J3_VITBC|nr:unnamed protein product [Vitrella brassicaformis CCMP3155]|eukprot:CEM21907.1 unnamed protein product [Vitrella brassicaformis CCMP3155]
MSDIVTDNHNGVSLDDRRDSTSGDPPAAPKPAKYIPPHLRRKLADEQTTGGGGGSSSEINRDGDDREHRGGRDRDRDDDYTNGYRDRGRDNDRRDMGGGCRRDNDRFDRGRDDRFDSHDRDRGFDRRDSRDRDGGRSRGFGGGGGYGDRDRFDRGFDRGGGGRGSSRVSETGTGWDIRDGRRYIPEDEAELFTSEGKMSTGINFDKYDQIPCEVTGRGAGELPRVESFQEIQGVDALLIANIKRVNYQRPTPIQKHSIPVVLAERDLMACAQTGSGKTAAFLFPIIAEMLRMGPPPPPENTRYNRRMTYPVSLVLAPTRELAIQIFEESRKFTYGTGIRAVVIYGGADVKLQFRELERGCDILVATPGRLVDLMERARVSLAMIKYLVFDEADRMLDMGFEPQIRRIVEQEDMPDRGRQTVMFSATFPREIQRLAADFLEDYIMVTIGRVGSTNEFIRQRLQYAEDRDKQRTIQKILEDQTEEGLSLVFVETKRGADALEHYLLMHQFPATSIHGDRSQFEREEALRAFKSGDCPILVATDVAARGLDIPNVKQVINYDLPNNIDDYVHRIGRTGRAGNTGTAISFVNETNRPILRDLLGLLEEAQQEVPSWFSSMVNSCTASFSKFGNRFGGGRGGGRGGGGSRFGTRDMRNFQGGPQGRDYASFSSNDRDRDRDRGGSSSRAPPPRGYERDRDMDRGRDRIDDMRSRDRDRDDRPRGPPSRGVGGPSPRQSPYGQADDTKDAWDD